MVAEITQAGPGDSLVLAEMLHALAAELDGGHASHATPEILTRYGTGPDALFRAVIAREAGRPIGFALYFAHFSTWRGLPGAYVQDLCVLPEARGKGLGEDLLAATARDAAACWGAAYLMPSVDARNTGARRFYDRLGFRPQTSDQPMALDGDAFSRLQKARVPT